MNEQLQLYNINMKYIRNLANVDDNVLSVSPQTGKQNRPFIGILIMINGQQYCAPITSPKPKHKTMPKNFDFLKIMGKVGDKEDIIGVINFNNMIPVHKSIISPINLKVNPRDNAQTEKYKVLLGNQLSWCRSHAELIEKNSQKTYNMVTTGKGSRNLIRRCCDFKKLELVLEKWLAKEESRTTPEDMAKYERTNEKCNAILDANPELRDKLNFATVEYCQKHNLDLPDSLLPADKRYEMRNAILNENPNLKAEYIKAKTEFEQAPVQSQLRPKPKPKHHK